MHLAGGFWFDMLLVECHLIDFLCLAACSRFGIPGVPYWVVQSLPPEPKTSEFPSTDCRFP